MDKLTTAQKTAPVAVVEVDKQKFAHSPQCSGSRCATTLGFSSCSEILSSVSDEMVYNEKCGGMEILMSPDLSKYSFTNK